MIGADTNPRRRPVSCNLPSIGGALMRGARNLIIPLVFSLVMPVMAFGHGISCLDQARLRSTAAGRPAIITFVNNSRHSANIYWIDYAGKRAQSFDLAPGSVISRNTLVTHPWVITDEHDNCIGVAFANPSTPNVEITDSGVVFSGTSGPALADNPVYANQAKHDYDEAGGPQAIQAMHHDEAGTVTYRGQIGGRDGEIFSLKIGPVHEGKSWVAVYVGANGCLGDIDGEATVRGDVLEFTTDDGGNDCSLNIHRSATGATIVENSCVSGHGAACSFDTQGQTLHQVEPVPAASGARAGPNQAVWRLLSGNGGVGATGWTDSGVPNITFSCGTKPRPLGFSFSLAEDRERTLRKVIELEQPFVLEIRTVSGEKLKYSIVAYLAGDGGWTTGESGLTGSAATAFLDAFGKDGRLSLQTGEGVKLASWTLKGTSEISELMRKTCSAMSMPPLAALADHVPAAGATQAQKMAPDGNSGLSRHAGDTVVNNFLAAQRSYEESTNAQGKGSAIVDLNGDGKPEIVLVWTTLGPTYWYNTLTVFSQISGRYKPVSSLQLNGEARLSSAKGGVIFVDQTMYAKDDPLCCPTIRKRVKYRWSANKLSQLPN